MDLPRDVMSPEIEEALNLRLQRSSYLALRNVRCVCRNGAVVLKGSLPTHYLKQLLLAIVAEIAGDYAIENEVGVTGPSRREPVGREGGGGAEPPRRSQGARPGAGGDRRSRSEGRD
jgi:hypothetical protein